jgi:hypothetical protein
VSVPTDIRKIVSSKHSRAGFSGALIGVFAALAGVVGTILFFLFVKR